MTRPTPGLPPTRRSFVTAAGAALAVPALPPLPADRAAPHAVAPDGLSVLVLGGTGFLGPHFVRAALARGHRLTLFNRGRTNPDLFPDLEKLQGDREKGELQALQGRTFDAVIDTSGYVPAHVEATAKLFADSCRHYQFISSISVYPAFGQQAIEVDEQSPVGEVDDATVAKVETIRQSMPFYGPLKARCEAAAAAALPGKVANLRPGLIVGPGDPTDRFTWWPVRVDRGSEVLCPGDPDAPVQVIDVRDLADFMVRCMEGSVAGTFNAVGFPGRVSMAEFLGACKCATANPVTLVWGSEEFLTAEQVGPWMEMPLWLPRAGRTYAQNARAIAAGLTFRPLADTIRDTLHWARTGRGDRPFARTGLKPEREQELLAKLRTAGGGR